VGKTNALGEKPVPVPTLHQKPTWIDMIYDILVNCNWFDTRWQLYSTHLHTNNNRTTQLTTWLECFLGFETRMFKLIGKSVGRAPSLRVIPLHLP
jgi:hypothetical protein